jgi:hypothetical protein
VHVQAQARPQPSALHSHKRASHISVRANIASVAVVLVDDRHQRNIEVVQVISAAAHSISTCHQSEKR